MMRCMIIAIVAMYSLAVTAQENSPRSQDRDPRTEENGTDQSEPVAERQNRIRTRRIETAELLSAEILSQGDVNRDRRLSRDEFTKLAARWYDSLNTSKSDALAQEEFLRRFGELMPPAPRRSFGGSRPDPYLGLFVVVDADRNALLTKQEFVAAFALWFGEWTGEKRDHLEREHILVGLRAALPRTNMGIGVRGATQERLPGLPEQPPSPVLSPSDAIKTIQLAEGFHLELAAAEPLIEDPISLSFDEDGRLYVLEMRSYMLDIDGTDERKALGRISRLEDRDRDGRFDTSTVFVDQLVLPRAVAATNGGVLYVSDYQLYFARDTDADGIADETQLVDPDYGGGNVEHAPNGLMMAMDNWIYNARSQYRYRWIGDVLVKQPTENRGQWGLTQDNFGRLFYNVNNSQLLGDFAPPNYMSRNPHHSTSAGLNLFVATDQRVFPIRMNTAVNRGYLPDVLDSDGKLYVFASSCSPVIYRGDNFPPEFVGNAFVCDSAANLIKRNLVFDTNLTLTSKFAYEGFEFLASSDERFRPVGLFNGPDGALWTVDMYRGINQHGMFMTEYLRKETLERGLDKGTHLGRIYRILSNVNAPAQAPRLSQESSTALVDRLSDSNGWIRDTAQRLLVERSDQSVLPALLQLVSTGTDTLGRLHAIWTLEGLFISLPKSLLSPDHKLAISTVSPSNKMAIRLLAVDPTRTFDSPSLTEEVIDACFEAMQDESPHIQIAAIRVAESLTSVHPEYRSLLHAELVQLNRAAPPEVLFQVALTAGSLSKPDSLPLLADIAAQNAKHLLIREAVVSGLHRWEVPFLKTLLADPRWKDEQPGRFSLLRILATAVMKERHPSNIDELLTLAADQTSNEAFWRKQSLLTGMTARTGSRSAAPVRMKSAPEGLARLSSSSDDETQQRSEQIKSLLAWPGHQSDKPDRYGSGRALTSDEEAQIAAGEYVFRTVCAGCHGMTGEGIRPLAAPLVDSDWVLGSEDRLIRVLLHGLTGPVEVDGIVYQPPVVLPEMPAVGTLADDKIAAVLSFIRREWGHTADPVSASRVKRIRDATKERKLPWTAKELDVETGQTD